MVENIVEMRNSNKQKREKWLKRFIKENLFLGNLDLIAAILVIAGFHYISKDLIFIGYALAIMGIVKQAIN